MKWLKFQKTIFLRFLFLLCVFFVVIIATPQVLGLIRIDSVNVRHKKVKNFQNAKNPLKTVGFLSEGRRIRTFDRLLRRQVLYPAELCLHCSLKKIVGVAGFEPAASCSQSRRDNRATLHPESTKRRVRDSNPWYSFPYACLANMSFRPLRQLSKLKERIGI